MASTAGAANDPISPLADEILYRKGIAIIPGITANAGGAIAGCFE